MGRFQQGQEKPAGSGRKKGARNRRTTDLVEIFDGLNFSAPEELVKILPELPVEKRVDALIDLMSFLYPKRKAIEKTEIAGDADTKRFKAILEMSPEQRDHRYCSSYG